MFFRISDLGFVNSHTLPECGGPGVVQKRGFDWKNDPFSTMVTGETSETEKRGQNSWPNRWAEEYVVGIGVTRQWIFGCDILGVFGFGYEFRKRPMSMYKVRPLSCKLVSKPIRNSCIPHEP